LLWARTAVLKMANAPASRMVEIFMVHSLALAFIIRIMRAGSCLPRNPSISGQKLASQQGII
jgi:hypothetical protein